jgi:hypothetical protein
MLLLSIQPKLSLQYKIINSANIKKKLRQYRYWLSFSDIGLVFFYIGRVYDFIITYYYVMISVLA